MIVVRIGWWYNGEKVSKNKNLWKVGVYMKVICEKCESSFKYEVIENMKCCPVCGEPFESVSSNDERTENINASIQVQDDETEEGLMYFDEIVIFDDAPKHNHVFAYCRKCKEIDALKLNLFNELIDKDHVTLKDDVVVKCKGCGKEHKPRKIMYKRKDHYAPPLPRCPACNSAMLKKITKGSKFIAAATVGMFALPYNSKTFECKDCGYRF